jgi:hypothetical protein
LLVPYLFHLEWCHTDTLHYQHLSRNQWHCCLASIFLRGSVETDELAFCVSKNNIGALTEVPFPWFNTTNTDVHLYIPSLASSHWYMIIQHSRTLQVPTSLDVHDAGDECSSWGSRENTLPLCQGWPNLLNVRATYDKLQMFESRKTWTNITHTFLLLHAHFVTKITNIKITF